MKHMLSSKDWHCETIAIVKCLVSLGNPSSTIAPQLVMLLYFNAPITVVRYNQKSGGGSFAQNKLHQS